MGKIRASISDIEFWPEAQPIIFTTASFLAGILWIFLTLLVVLPTGLFWFFLLRYQTEPVVSVFALISIYGLIHLHGNKFQKWGTVGYYLLFGGFLLVGVPTALYPTFFINFPGIIGSEGGHMLFTTLFGLIMIYSGFMLIGIESSKNDYTLGRTRTYILLGVFPAAIGAFILVIIFNLPFWVTAIVGPAGIGLAVIGTIIYTLSKSQNNMTVEQGGSKA